VVEVAGKEAKSSQTSAWLDVLARTECPALTQRRARRSELAGAAYDPIVWQHAQGVHVHDVDGQSYVDFTAGFGALAVGHAHPRVVAAITEQSSKLLHALGDVYPSTIKIELLDRLAQLAPLSDAKIILGLSGSDAVEAALKTALLYTGKPGVLAFTGGYHGLAYAPLAACGLRTGFRQPFSAQLNPHVVFTEYPNAKTHTLRDAMQRIDQAWSASTTPIGAVLFEPILGRGGIVVPPSGLLKKLGEMAHARGAVIIADEVFTGLGRCGTRWRSMERSVEASDTPDILCVGKALGGGMPISACIAPANIMAAWGTPDKEALHTGTFFGHPLACAAALAALDVIDDEGLVERARTVGETWLHQLQQLRTQFACIRDVRGEGLMLGIEFDSGERTLRVIRQLLERGYLTLTAGINSEVLSLTPPLIIEPPMLTQFVETLAAVLKAVT